MGCLFSISNNTCVNVLDVSLEGDVKINKKESTGFLSLFKSSSLSLNIFKKSGEDRYAISEALENLQKAVDINDVKVLNVCNICKKDKCNKDCKSAEIFSRINPIFYTSVQYGRNFSIGKNETTNIETSFSHVNFPSDTKLINRSYKKWCSSDTINANSLSQASSIQSFKTSNRRSIRSISAFPVDGPIELGIRPQLSLSHKRSVSNDYVYVSSEASSKINKASTAPIENDNEDSKINRFSSIKYHSEPESSSDYFISRVDNVNKADEKLNKHGCNKRLREIPNEGANTQKQRSQSFHKSLSSSDENYKSIRKGKFCHVRKDDYSFDSLSLNSEKAKEIENHRKEVDIKPPRKLRRQSRKLKRKSSKAKETIRNNVQISEIDGDYAISKCGSIYGDENNKMR